MIVLSENHLERLRTELALYVVMKSLNGPNELKLNMYKREGTIQSIFI